MDDEKNTSPKGPGKNPSGFEESRTSFDYGKARSGNTPLDGPGESGPSKGPERAKDAFDGFVVNQPSTPSFTGEDAQIRDGNYVLSFGLSGSGKSTFHSFLLRHLEHGGQFNSSMRLPTTRGEPDYQAKRLINAWKDTWKTGRFVNATANTESAIREISYHVTPIQGVKTPLDFSMIEVAGELLERVEGRRTAKPSLPDAIYHLLGNPRVNLILIVLVHPDTPRNDILFDNLLDFIGVQFPERRRNMSLGVVIANPDKALQQLKARTGGEDSDFAHVQHLEDEIVFDYLELMAPGILTKLNSWDPDRRMVTPLKLGDIDYRTNDDGDIEPVLVRFNPRDIGKVFDWMYTQFTGKKLGPTLMQRFLSGMSKPPQ